MVDRYYMTYNDYGHISDDPKVAALTLPVGTEIGHHLSLRRAATARPGILPDHRPGLVRRRRRRKVEVSTDGGQTWKDAEIRAPVIRMAHTRFGMNWKWDGKECVLQSRCTDELGQVQPTRAQVAKFFNVAPDYYHATVSRALTIPFNRGE